MSWKLLVNKKEIAEILVWLVIFAPVLPVYAEEPAAEEPAVEINTGDAVSTVDTVNEINTQSVNSETEIVVESGSLGDSPLDLRPLSTTSTSTEKEADEATTTCDDCLNLDLEIQNAATTTNEIIVSAESGGNSASSTATTTIETGNAYAAANVVNVVNTNIVDSNYTLVVFNNFGDFGGDIVLPGEDFFAKFLSFFAPLGCGNCQNDSSITSANQAAVSNSLNISANSGLNDSSGENSSIETGDAKSVSNIYNLINTDIYGSSFFYLLIKVTGGWSGNILNLPTGLAWEITPQGVVLYSQPANSNSANNYTGAGRVNANIDTSAVVKNDINVTADTGGNSADGETAIVRTGDAYAAANAVNIVNTNIVSSNWFLALINILGNWTGNISFGQPNLWVGTLAEVSGNLKPGSTVKFTTTVKNNGDARATNIKVSTTPEEPYLMVNGHEHHFDFLDPGEKVEFSYMGSISNYLPDFQDGVRNKTEATASESDADPKDNTDLIYLRVTQTATVLLPHRSRTATYPELSITRTHRLPSAIIIDGQEQVPWGGKIEYKTVIKNSGGLAHEGVLVDQIKNQKGEVLSEKALEIGEIMPGEEVTVTYTTELGAGAAGHYTDDVWVEAVGGDYEAYDGSFAEDFKSNVVSSEFLVSPQVVYEEFPKKEEAPSAKSEIIKPGKNLEESDSARKEPGLIFGNYCFGQPLQDLASYPEFSWTGIPFRL